MMKTLLLSLFLALSLVASTGHACMPSYRPYFELPSYADPDFKDPGYTDMSLGRKYMFAKILRECQVLQPAEFNPSDLEARETSKLSEPEAYAKYLVAAALFNVGSYKEALPHFEELRRSIRVTPLTRARRTKPVADSWVREASTYMIARCHLKIAQNNLHGYSRWSIDVDSASAEQAKYVYSDYLKEYPNGMYSYSARNLKRFFCNFSDKYCNLDSAIVEAMQERFPIDSVSPIRVDRSHDVIKELLTYYNGTVNIAIDPPVMTVLAVWDVTPLSENDILTLSKRKSEFSLLPGLFEYVMSTALYRLGKHQEVVDLTTQITGPKNRIWLSTMLLRARSLVNLAFPDSALHALQLMHNESPEDAIEVEMAVTALNSGNGLWPYTNISPIQNEDHLAKFAYWGLTDSQLVVGIQRTDIMGDKRDVLVNELAKRYLIHGQYALLKKLLTVYPDCAYAGLKNLIQALLKNPRGIVAMADLGEYMYNFAVTPWKHSEDVHMCWGSDGREVFDQRYTRHETPSQLKLLPPEVLFKTVVELSKKSGRKSDAEAKALHYLVTGSHSRLFAHMRLKWTYRSESDSTLSFNKAAFQRLHRLYKDSKWAKATPYYYQ